MVEDLLHFVWKHKLFNASHLVTTNQQEIVIHKAGEHNHSSGPDFSEAQISIDHTLWAGSVEIHVKSSDWISHGHSADAAYDNVILHVVYENDIPILDKAGNEIPTFELKGRISASIIRNYESLKFNKSAIPCKSSISSVSQLEITSWLNRVLIERLERKSEDVDLLFKATNGDWLQTFYSMLAGYLGQNHNKLPMIELARRVPYNAAIKNSDKTLTLEALMIGVGGFLSSAPKSDYEIALISEYSFLRSKYGLTEITQGWKTGQIRPDNSPIKRVVQFAAMVPFVAEAFHELIESGNYNWSQASLDVSDFWKNHYSFSAPAKRPLSTNISPSMSDILAINVHAPFLFYYGQKMGEDDLKDKALNMLESLKSENNKIVRMWNELDINAKTAFESQALIELQSQYCSRKKCVNCNLGKWIITSQ